MALRLIPRAPWPRQRYWQPFEKSPVFNDAWWCSAVQARPDEYLSVLDDDVEVVRVRFGLNWRTYYVGVPSHVRQNGLEIRLIETAAGQRRRRYASLTVAALASAHPSRVLVAYSEFDDFWKSLGWNEYYHEDAAKSPEHYRTLFVDSSST